MYRWSSGTQYCHDRMCGIAGFWAGRTDPQDLLPDVRRMSRTLPHRGPDSDGHWTDPQHGIALGHRRLAIVDLSPEGHQPMVSHSGRYVVAFNGEIYNFRAIRKELEGRG